MSGGEPVPEAQPQARPEASRPKSWLDDEVRLNGRAKWLVLGGALIGFVSALCGIGGGLFTVPLLHFGFKLALRRAVATSLTLVFATTTAATITEVLRDDCQIRWTFVGFLVVGTLVGAQLGFALSKRFDARDLRGLFAIVILVAALRTLFAGSAGDVPDEAVVPGTWNYVYSGLAGFLGGVFSPLLGIGGGLVMVPALFLGPSTLAFAGARACSMATAVVTSGRSVSLFWKERSIHSGAAPRLAAGALVGAVLGVMTVHQPGVVAIARQLLGLVLLFVSLRFAWAWKKGH